MLYTIFRILTIVFGIVFIILAIKTIKKDKSKWLEISVAFAMSAFFFFLVYPINQYERKQEAETTSQISTSAYSTTKESSTVSTTTEKTTTTTTIEPSDPVIKSNEVTKNLSYIDDYCTVTFQAPITGKYRFDFLTNDTQSNYDVTLTDSKNEMILDSEYDTYNHGETRELIKGELYTLMITQKEGFPKATIKIHVPSENAVLVFND